MKSGNYCKPMIAIDLSSPYYLIMNIYLLGIDCLTSCTKSRPLPVAYSFGLSSVSLPLQVILLLLIVITPLRESLVRPPLICFLLARSFLRLCIASKTLFGCTFDALLHGALSNSLRNFAYLASSRFETALGILGWGANVIS